MQLVASNLRWSPSDLSGFLGCRHRTGLDLAVVHGALATPAHDDAFLQSMRDRGAEHERAYVTSLRAEGLTVVEIPSSGDMSARADATRTAMRDGAEVIVQAALLNGQWGGYADVLRRVSTRSELGAWSYEPYDTKLAREPRGGTILQLAVYVDLLTELQGTAPERFHVVTPSVTAGDFITHSYRFNDYAAYFRVVRAQFKDTVAFGHEAIRAKHYPEPVEHCDICRWWDRCNARRRADDHLSFIAGAARLHREELTAHGVTTLAAAAVMPVPVAFTPSRGSRDTYERIAQQARLQLQQRTTNRPVHELLPVEAGKGLGRLPEPSPGDLFLDLEGARFAREGGREYLFGLWARTEPEGPASAASYSAWWAFTDADERVAFEALIDRIMAAWQADPGMHIYHFNHYEPTALKRLMGRYATRGGEVDRLLRGERFVDLYTVVRQAVRAGVESYSIKQLEQFYGFTRDVALRDASAHLQAMELALESGATQSISDDVRDAVKGYNRDDCRSTEALRDWLEGERKTVLDSGIDLPRPAPRESEANDKVSELEARQRAAREKLLARITPEETDPAHPEHPYWLLAYLLDWHRREDKSAWWEYFRLSDLPEEDLLDERAALGELRHVARLSEEHFKNGNLKLVVDRYSYPLQETELRRGSKLRMPGGAPVGAIVRIDRIGLTIDIEKGRKTADVHPAAVFEAEVIGTNTQQEALLRFAEAVDAEHCGTDLLFRRTPRLHSGAWDEFARRLAAHPGTAADIAIGLATDLDRTALAIQGPPGAGKTYVGAQMIRALVGAGKKVGVTAVSHKVIRNLLDAVTNGRADDIAAGRPPGPNVRLGHKCDAHEDEAADNGGVRVLADNAAALAALAGGEIDVLGATSWLWSREDFANTVDVLFVDEAGQMSLANALAVTGAAGSLVLLGDPQQLEQPQKGTHPDGVGASALEHVLAGAATMPPERGLFLPTTWRLHPSICAFTSELFYENKLQPRDGLERQRLFGAGDFDGAGLWFVPVAHDGNQNYSPEEVDVVVRIVDQLLGTTENAAASRAEWVDAKGCARALTPEDLRIVAPFNAQVNRIAERLGARGVPVGTVDKFQGQEAPVVIYSMATSRAEDAPRGMEFLYSLNRLNVATSRAQCVAIVVASPNLTEPACRTPRQMLLASALCRFSELSDQLRSRTRG